MSAAAAPAAPKSGHVNDQAQTAPTKPQLELVHNVAEPENGVTPPKGELHSVKEGEVPSWKEVALSPFKWMSKSVRRLLVGAPPAVGSVIGWTREKVGDVMGTGWGVTKRTGELIQRNLRSISIEPFGIPLMRTGIVRLDASIYSMCDKENRTLLPNYFARDLILDRDIKFAAGSYIMGQRPHQGYNWRSVQNRVYGPLEKVFDAVTGKEIPLGEPLKEDLVVRAGTFIGKGSHMARKSEIMGQAHREMTDKLFEEIITRDEGRFTHNWTLQQPGNRTYRLPEDIKVGVDMPNGIGRAFTDPNGGVHAVGANITAGTVIPAGTEIDSGVTIPYNTKVVKAEEIDEIPEQRIEKTVALKEKIVLKSPLRVGAPMRINHPFVDNSVVPHGNYAARAWIPAGAVIPTGTTLDKGTKITAGSELMATVTSIPAGLLKQSVMLSEDFILPADLRLGADLPQGLTVGFWDYLNPPGGPPTWHAEGTPLPAGTSIAAGTKLNKGTILPAGSEMPEEFEVFDINDPAEGTVQITEAGVPISRRRLRGPKRVTTWPALHQDIRLSEYGLLVPDDFKPDTIINPLTNKPYKMVEIPYEFVGHKFKAQKIKYMRILPEDTVEGGAQRANVLFAGTKLPDGVIVSGGSWLDRPSHGPVLPGGRLTADFNLDDDFTMGGPLKLGRATANIFQAPLGTPVSLTIGGITYAPGHMIPAGTVVPQPYTAPAIVGAPPPTPVILVIPGNTVVPGGSEISPPKTTPQEAVMQARRLADDALRAYFAIAGNASDARDPNILRGRIAQLQDYHTAIGRLPSGEIQTAEQALNDLVKSHCIQVLRREALNEVEALRAAVVALPSGYKAREFAGIQTIATSAEGSITRLANIEGANGPESTSLRNQVEGMVTRARNGVTP